ncbi:MAG: type 2 isopentenyl-diphosphate Delta-isomerase [Ignavibacteria bacterium]|jgi:isopentenyl-diphosphate delta-isomerase
MASDNNTSLRKKEHLDLCLTDDVSFSSKTNGFEHYDFKHNAITEVLIEDIGFTTKFLKHKIDYPFLISCMTGGTSGADNINAQLAIVAKELNIPVGVGSQRQALEDDDYIDSFKIVRENAPGIPVLSNIGAAQIVQFKSIDPIKKIIDMIEADALVIHLNPLQEVLQKEGETNFKGLIPKIKKITKSIDIPVIAKEVGSGISAEAALRLLDVGVEGIDVAGAGGTSWAGVELLRSGENKNHYLWDWGLPTSYCISEVKKLKKNYKFTLIGSGGINTSLEAAKAFALGADMVASARMILKVLDESGVEGTVKYITDMFNEIRIIMYLTGSKNLKALKKGKLIKREVIF